MLCVRRPSNKSFERPCSGGGPGPGSARPLNQSLGSHDAFEEGRSAHRMFGRRRLVTLLLAPMGLAFTFGMAFPYQSGDRFWGSFGGFQPHSVLSHFGYGFFQEPHIERTSRSDYWRTNFRLSCRRSAIRGRTGPGYTSGCRHRRSFVAMLDMWLPNKSSRRAEMRAITLRALPACRSTRPKSTRDFMESSRNASKRFSRSVGERPPGWNTRVGHVEPKHFLLLRWDSKPPKLFGL